MKRRYYRKPHRYRRKKSFLRKKFFWLSFLAFGVFAGAFYCLFFLQAFQIEKIIVSGEEKIVKQDIEFLVEQRLENKVLFLKTRSIFAVDLGQIKKDILNQFPQVAELKVSRGFFDAVKVSIVERQPVAQWCQGDICFLLDNSGVIFEELAGLKPDLILIKTFQSEDIVLGDKVIDGDLLAQIFDIKDKVSTGTKVTAVEATVASQERLNMKTEEGWQIYFNLKGDIGWQVTELVLVLEKQIPQEQRGSLEYIDLRFSRVFYK